MQRLEVLSSMIDMLQSGRLPVHSRSDIHKSRFQYRRVVFVERSSVVYILPNDNLYCGLFRT